jgi:hypothetical protein
MTTSVQTTSLLAGVVLVTCAVASCAESDPTTTAAPDSGASPLPALDAGSEATPDDDCLDAGDGGCAPRALTCAEADFCTVPTGIDARHTLLDVWGSSERDVWTVGSGGTILHWDGVTWARVPFAGNDTFHGVGGSGVSDVWVVSSLNLVLQSPGFASIAGFALRPPLDPTDAMNRSGASLSKVWSPGPGTIFVGGPPTTNRTGRTDSLWRFRYSVPDGQAWEPVSTFCRVSPCAGVEGIWGTSADDVWVIGEKGGVRRSKGPVGIGGAEEWSTMDTTLTSADLHGIWGSSASDVWIVGDRGTIRHWSNNDSQTWEIVPSNTTEDLRAVWGTGPSDVWVVGDAGTILRWDGTSWRTQTTTIPAGAKPRFSGVWSSGPNDVWVVGEAGALHFGGAR